MRRTRLDLRLTLFDRGERAFRALTGDKEPVYYCPICERGFERSAAETGLLTLEHVPPRARGGRAIALTCEPCNSTAGHTIDAAAEERAQLFELNEALMGRLGRFDGRVTVVVNGLRVTADVTAEAGRVKLVLLSKYSDPAIYDHALELLREGAATASRTGFKFNLNPRLKIHVRRAKVGDLKSAYVAAFARFGYCYAFNFALARVRSQIRSPDLDVLPAWWILPDVESPPAPLMALTSMPVESLAVQFTSGLVVLPWTSGAGDPYAALERARDERGHVRFTGSPIAWPKGLEMDWDFAGQGPSAA